MEGKDIVEDVIVETIEKLQGLLRDGDRLTVTSGSARLVRWGRVEALGTDVVAVFLVTGRQNEEG